MIFYDIKLYLDIFIHNINILKIDTKRKGKVFKRFNHSENKVNLCKRDWIKHNIVIMDEIKKRDSEINFYM